MSYTPLTLEDQFDRIELQEHLMKIFNIPSTMDLFTSPLWWALDDAGIFCFKEGLVPMPEFTLRTLKYRDRDTEIVYELPAGMKERLVAFLTYYHHLSRIAGRFVLPEEYNVLNFLKWMATEWDPKQAIIKKDMPLPLRTDDPVTTWKKNIKITLQHLGTYDRIDQWMTFKKKLVRTLVSQGLSHLIDIHFKVVDTVLDDMQRA